MSVSVVICTWNRSALLRRTLESLRSVVVPPNQAWEVVVVNNNSSDATAEVIASFQPTLPVRPVLLRTMGASNARNAGVATATGDLLLFTDDDVELDPKWMCAHLDAARQWPDAAYFAGAIHPVFADDVPRWVVRHQTALCGMLCARNLGSEGRALQLQEFPWGPNMAIRRAAFAHAAFDGTIGRIGHGQMRGSEDSFFRALERQGASGAWVPEAKVGHQIPRSRATIPYLWRYYHGSGRGAARLEHPSAPPWPRQVRLTVHGLRCLVSDRREWPRHLADVARRTGMLVESRRLARGKAVSQGNDVEKSRGVA